MMELQDVHVNKLNKRWTSKELEQKQNGNKADRWRRKDSLLTDDGELKVHKFRQGLHFWTEICICFKINAVLLA